MNQWDYQKEKQGTEKNVWNNNDWKFSQIIFRYQTTDPWISENTKQNKCQENYTQAYYIQITEIQRLKKNCNIHMMYYYWTVHWNLYNFIKPLTPNKFNLKKFWKK